MHKRFIKRFLMSGKAIQAHILCLSLIILLSISLWTGEAQPDYVFGLLFVVIAYPVLLLLLWKTERLDEKAQIEHVVESITVPDKLRKKRYRWRRITIYGTILVAALLIYLGIRGVKMDFVPTQYIGCLLLAFVVADTFGVNVWYGGPLNPRHDPPSQKKE